MEWIWRIDSDDDELAPLLCRERDCIFHNGDGCEFPWIETPSKDEMRERGLCGNFVIVDGQNLLARINALF